MKQLKICPVRAYLSRKMDLLSENDAYALFKMGSQSQRTKTKTNERIPIWDQQLIFSEEGDNLIKIIVMDEDQVMDQEIGSATLDLTPYFRNQQVVQKFVKLRFKDLPAGKLLLRISPINYVNPNPQNINPVHSYGQMKWYIPPQNRPKSTQQYSNTILYHTTANQYFFTEEDKLKLENQVLTNKPTNINTTANQTTFVNNSVGYPNSNNIYGANQNAYYTNNNISQRYSNTYMTGQQPVQLRPDSLLTQNVTRSSMYPTNYPSQNIYGTTPANMRNTTKDYYYNYANSSDFRNLKSVQAATKQPTTIYGNQTTY